MFDGIEKWRNGYTIIINESDTLMLMRQLMPKHTSSGGARSVARKCLTVVFDFTRKSRHTDDLKKEKLRETKFLSIKLQYNYNTRLLRHETAIICKFNSRRSSYATMEREQAIAIVFIITWERERERERDNYQRALHSPTTAFLRLNDSSCVPLLSVRAPLFTSLAEIY